ncbi:MAG: hypothetical protein ACJ75R_07670 [Solirubrobacterales bacterium]
MSLTAHVDPAIELLEHRFRSRLGASDLAYLRSHAYFNQLSPADACLDSLLTYELDPSAGAPLGVNGGASLGAIVGVAGEFAVPVRRALAAVIASGYLTMLSSEDPPGSDWVPNRDAEALWRFWVRHLSPTSALALGIPPELAESVGRDGGAYLEAEIARLGLKPGLFRRRALSHRCAELAKFGLLLRVGQTTACSDAEFERSQSVDQEEFTRSRA